MNFIEPSGEATQIVAFQGSTLFNPIITTPIAVAIPNVGPHAQSRPIIAKPNQKRGIKNMVTKNPKTTAVVPIVDLIGEAGQSVSTSLIIDKNPQTSSIVLLGSRDPSPNIASAFVTLFETIPHGTNIATEEMEVDSTKQYCEPLQGNGAHTSSLVSLLLGLGPLPGDEPMVSTPQSIGIEQ